MRLLTPWLAVLPLLLPAPAVAQASVYDELKGLRSEAMGGAHRGLGTSNDALMLNPAGMTSMQRYSLDVLYGFTSADDLQHLSVTAVDSKSGPVAGALGYTHDRGDHGGADPKLHRFYMAAAYPILPGFSLGLTGRNIRGTYNNELGEEQEVSLYNGDVGVSLNLGTGLALGLVYNNALATDDEKFMPPTVAGGLAFVSGPISVAFDLAVDRSRDKSHRGDMTYFGGAEYMAGEGIALRGGYRSAPFVRKSGNEGREGIASGGLAYVTPTGSLEGTVTRSLERTRHWTTIGAIKFFL